jgi:hypothetical protein
VAHELKKIYLEGSTNLWYIDQRLCQLRNVDNPHDFKQFDNLPKLVDFIIENVDIHKGVAE